MKQLKKNVCLILMLTVFSLTTLSGCSLYVIDWSINDGFDDEEYIAPDYNFQISAKENSLNFSISNIGTYGENAKIVALAPYQYLYGEDYVGLSEEVGATPIEISNYECGTSLDFTANRFIGENNKIDGLYYKYYVLSNTDEILAGPMYCTEIEHINGSEDPLPAKKKKKGVASEDMYTDKVGDLGCSYTAISVVMDYMIAPNEFYNTVTKQIEPINYVEGVNEKGELTISHGSETWAADFIDYNGKRYYFRLDLGGGVSLRHYDNIIKKYTDDGVRVTLIMLLHNVFDKNNRYIQPYHITYPATAGNEANYVQFNTSNAYGANYWGAFMEFLGNRYSQKGSKCGNVFTYVLGNEVDAPTQWNQIVAPNQPALSLENYLEEYEREMRIANMALKKYHANSKVLISLTNHWASAYNEYAPKQMIDYLTLKTLNQGNYDYGLAAHPYGSNLGIPNFWSNDVSNTSMTGSLNTPQITWSNLEVLQLYLEQTTKRCNGKVRSVYLTEGGVSSSSPSSTMFEETLNQQAAGVAYLYIKCAQLSCVDAVIYYRLIDHKDEGIYFGLFTNDLSFKKPAYNVYKYIDTQFWHDISFPYLKYITWTVSLGPGIPAYTYGYNVGNVSGYKDTMKLFNSKFNWEVWNEDLIGVRIINEQDYI